MNKNMLAFSLLLLFLVSACSGGGGNVPPEFQYVFEVPDDPISVTPILDTERQAEAIIPASGGTLSVTGADGTIFQLDIPAGALVFDTLIRMIPVSTLDGMPFGSDHYAVQFEPNGLYFHDFVTLTITPAQDIPIDQQIVFSYLGEGSELVLAAPVVDSSEIKILMDHFSGSGVTKGFLADIEPVRERLGGSVERRLYSTLAEKLALERQRQFLGEETSEGVLEAFKEFFKEFEEKVLKPRLDAAGESCAAGQLAVQTAIELSRQKQLVGIVEGTQLDIGLLITVTDVCMQEEYELCRDEHIIHRIIPAWLGARKNFEVIGGMDQAAAVLEKAEELVRKCLTFEMKFESQGSFDDGFGGGFTSSVESTIELQFNTQDLTIKGQAPLDNTAFDYTDPDCAVSTTPGGGTFQAMDLSYISDTKSPTDVVGYVRDFKFIYYPGNTSESFTVTCPDQPSFTQPLSLLWTGIYLITHEGEMSEAAGGFTLEDWEIFGNEYFAKKEWITEDPGEGLTEAGTFMLYHLPE